MKALLMTSLLTLLSALPSPARAECIDWPVLMAKYGAERMAGWKTSVVLDNFDDFTKRPGDDWLSAGIPCLLAAYLGASKDINPIYGPSAKATPLAVNPAYVVQGMYQHVEGKLRMFVKLTQKGGLVKQWQYDINYPQNNEFFEALEKAALEIMAIAGPRYDREKLYLAKTDTQIVPAYENYIRGLLIYWTFQPERMEIAKTWFDEATKADMYYRQARLAIADMYTFLALYNKQYRKPYAQYLSLAQNELNEMEKFMFRPGVPKRPKRYMIKDDREYNPPANRFLIANSHFVAGLSAAGKQMWLEAARDFEQAVIYAPEDAITWYHLAQMREKTGDKRAAAEARAKAFEANKCLQ